MKRMMIVMMLQQQLLPLESHDNRSSGALLGGTRACMKQSVLATCWPGVCLWVCVCVYMNNRGCVCVYVCLLCAFSPSTTHPNVCRLSLLQKHLSKYNRDHMPSAGFVWGVELVELVFFPLHIKALSPCS